MTPSKHSAHSMKWESSKKDKEMRRYGGEGSKKEESYDQRQMSKSPMKKKG